MAQERLQKILSKAGIASRRQAEQFILEGAITVNGKVVTLGAHAEWGKDAIKVHGKLLQYEEERLYLLFYKPKNVLSALTDPHQRSTLKDYLRHLKKRLYPVGRLDFSSEGLLFLTNDGTFGEKLQKKEDLLKRYTVKIKGHPNEEKLARLYRPSSYDEVKMKKLRPHSVEILEKLAKKSLLDVTLLGPQAFDLRLYFQNRGFLVEKITRTAIGPFTLKDLSPGSYRPIKHSQAMALIQEAEPSCVEYITPSLEHPRSASNCIA